MTRLFESFLVSGLPSKLGLARFVVEHVCWNPDRCLLSSGGSGGAAAAAGTQPERGG